MGHHWPGADQPEDADDRTEDRYRRSGDRSSGGGSWGGGWGGGWGHGLGAGWGGDQGRRRGPAGPPPWLQDVLGFTGGPPQRPAARGPKVRRGDVRTAIVDVLRRARVVDEPINGYQVIQEISELSNGEWRPSPGSVYPTIQQLQDEGLVETDDERGRRTIRLTDEGVAWATDHDDELMAVWAPFARSEEQVEQSSGQGADIKGEIGQVMSAVWQLATQGSDSQRRAAFDVLVDTRRRLYGILADGRDGSAS